MALAACLSVEVVGEGAGVLPVIEVVAPPQPAKPPTSTKPKANGATDLPNETLILFPFISTKGG